MKKITLFISFLIFTTVNSQSLIGTWKISPLAGSIGVGPNQGDTSWWSNTLGDVTTRACLFDDEYVFNANGTFTNVLGSQTWLEGWQGMVPDACGTPVFPHNGANAATWTHNTTNNTVTLNGVGAFLGLAKATNTSQLSSPSNAPASVTYTITSLTSSLLTLDISYGSGWWRFILAKQTVASPLEGTWKINPQVGAIGVGPNQGDTSWWSNTLGDITTRACLFDDEYVFNANGTFTNVLGSQTWLEGWQGVVPDACGTPVFPHNGANAATWTHNTTNNTVTLNGVGAFLGLAKATNTSQLSSPSNAPASVTYTITSLTSSLLTLDISYGSGWWRFVLVKQGVTPTCTDGIQNGTETGVDCGGTCTACLTQINLPVNFEGSTTNYAVTDFGGNASSLVVDPTNTSNKVIKTIKTSTAQDWAGTTIGTNLGFSSAVPFTTTNRKVYVSVWSPDAGIPVRLKVEDKNDNTHNCETQTNTTVVGWQTMEFDFNNQASGTAAFNPAFTFDKMSIFFNFGTTGAIAGEKIYYFDNVNYGSALSNQSFDMAKISMFPNPTSNMLTITSANKMDAITVYSVVGQEVMNVNVNADNTVLNVSGLQDGIYLVKVISEGKVSTSKFIKQ
jgi:hypothetical protein